MGRGQEISPGEGRSAPALPAKRRGRPKKVGICPADDKCAGCIRKTGCERVKHAEPATSAPAESPKPRERHAPERYEEAFPAEIRDHRESDHEAARKKLKPPPVTESPIVAWLTGAAVKQAIAKAARSEIGGRGYGHTENRVRLVRMHAQGWASSMLSSSSTMQVKTRALANQACHHPF